MEDAERACVPAGTEDYAELVSRYRYVDKTLLIKDMTDRPVKVYRFARPGRFGKTLNLSMLRTFFEKTDKNSSVYFKDKKIWSCGSRYTSLQGKYPVIYLAFKDAAGESWKEAYAGLKGIIASEYMRHEELYGSNGLDAYDIRQYESIVQGTATEGSYELSLLQLTSMLHTHYGVKPLILIDDYDAPLMEGYRKGYYDEVNSFMAGLLGAALKTNPDLEFAVMTGVTGTTGDSLYGGLNNVQNYSMLDDRYCKHFGFTQDEVEDLLWHRGRADKKPEVREWYSGYQFGDTTVYNPWSVAKYIANGFKPGEYWAKPDTISCLKKLAERLSAEDRDKISRLGGGDVIEAWIDETADYPALMEDSREFFTLLLYTGYVMTAGKCEAYAAGQEPADTEDEEAEDWDDTDDEDANNGDCYFLVAPNKEARMALRCLVR
ncbi:MAG: AAA family ATPase [Clostridia bacterium]|nr:AAA family ATPase [Clostridia bacterium]